MNVGEVSLLLGLIAVVAVAIVALLEGWATDIVNGLPTPVIQQAVESPLAAGLAALPLG